MHSLAFLELGRAREAERRAARIQDGAGSAGGPGLGGWWRSRRRALAGARAAHAGVTSGSQQRAGRSLVKLLIAVVVVLAAGTVHARAVGASVHDVPRALDASAHHGHGFEPSLAELAAKPKFKDGSAVAAEAGKFPKDRDLIGTVRTWVVNDKFFGVDFFKDFTLRGVGKTVEVWVASGDDGVSRGLEYPAGDCRNGTLTRVTDEQIDYLMHEFDQTIRPRQAEVFGDPLARDGSNALLPRWFPSIPADAYRGDGRRTVVLVDNIRDAEFYGPGSGQVQGYIAPRFMEYFDRNVLVLTGVNWDHRLGKRPLETLDAPDPCVRRRAWPLHIEAVLAHEFHHVRFFDEVLRDGADTTWRNEHWVFEGMAEWQLSRTPYIDSRSRDVLRNLFLNCFLGWTALTGSFACPGTPEDSLTIWGDDSPGDGWALDYGAASSFMHFLHGRYGDRFMAALLADNRRGGLPSVQGVIADAGRADDVGDLVPDWSATLALDAALDDGARLLGGDPDRYGVPSLHAAVNWDRGGAFGRPGVTPNASDFIRLRDADGRPLPAGEIDSIRFARRADSVAWTTRDGALHSGDVPIADRSIAREVEVPRDDPALTFDTRYRTEAGFDFGFVQVSADGGASWRSLPSTHTTSVADSGALSGIARQLPGFTGDSGGWLTERIDLSQHAGERVLIAFRYLTDPFVNLEGWSIDNVAIGGALLSAGDDIDAWRTIADTQPGAMSVRLVAISDDEKVARIAELPLDHSGAGELSGAALQQQIGDSSSTVAAIVTNADVTESYTDGPLWPFAYDGVRRYTLTVNDVVQTGG